MEAALLLAKSEVESSLKLVEAAFPHFSDWTYNNEVNESYSGFSVWGELVLDADESMPRSFFVTFDTRDTRWGGHLSIGKPCYFWTSADFGDAYLLDTGDCATLEDAIATLKRRMTDLFAVLLGSSD